MGISSTARMFSNAPINIVYPYIFHVNTRFTVSYCSAGDCHVASLLAMTVLSCAAKYLDKSKFEKSIHITRQQRPIPRPMPAGLRRPGHSTKISTPLDGSSFIRRYRPAAAWILCPREVGPCILLLQKRIPRDTKWHPGGLVVIRFQRLRSDRI